ncbi:MAG TPA: ATP cone domain-containing protein [Candidatus Nitrosotalea sp.]|nr:ATP cone domain-containing protein [Candidatus Nitrosotalea sp.]
MNHTNKIYVIKSDGTRTPFDLNKVRKTCIRAGASKKTANTIASMVANKVRPNMRTNMIYKMVLQALASEEEGQIVRHRYRLKESLLRMGPAGFKFEDYVARLLENTGYQINSLRAKLDGRCVRHEVDISVYSKATDKRCMVECKYHNLPGIFTGIKESLYTHARFLDLGMHFESEMLVTNTKVSTDVMTYASCIGQEIISWRYPQGRSLESLIETHGLYPLTILPISRRETFSLFNSGIEIAKDLLLKDPDQISRTTGIPLRRIRNLQDLTRQIIS